MSELLRRPRAPWLTVPSGLVLAACGTAPPIAPPPAPVAAVAPAPAPAPASPPDAPAAPPDAPAAAPATELAAFARIDADVSRAYPLRAVIRRAGPLYLAHDGPIASAGRATSVRLPVTAIDGDATGAPRRPRVVCEESAERVAVYLNAGDLATVALRGAATVRTADADVHAAIAADAPGAHFVAGAELEVLTSGGGLAVAKYHGLFLEAWGGIASDLVDVVFTPEPASTPIEPDGKLVRNVSLSYEPDGNAPHVFARVAKGKRVGNELLVRRLAKPVNGFVLVRYDEDDAYAIGWVPAAAVRDYRAPDESYGGLSGTGGSDRATSPHVKLARGTLLADPDDGAIVGVVTAETDVVCRRDCTGAEPLVAVDACAGTLQVRARAAR